jgi:hypothetical protein
MTRLLRASRGMLVAVAVLALTAGIALAGRAIPASHQMPDAAASGLQRASEAAGKTVPVAAPESGTDGNENADETEPPETEAPETEPPESPDAGQPGGPTAEHPANHGADVSKAAQAETPAGFDNHGQYVRSIAMANHGPTVAASHRNASSNGAHPNH